MIIDSLSQIGRYRGLSSRLDAAIAFLQTADLDALPTGRTDIDGNFLYLIKSHTVLVRDTMLWEAHKQYIDIQIILHGRERFGGGSCSFGTYDESNDFYPCQDVEEFQFSLSAGQFAVFFPMEPHSPGNYSSKGEASTKCIIKVAV